MAPSVREKPELTSPVPTPTLSVEGSSPPDGPSDAASVVPFAAAASQPNPAGTLPLSVQIPTLQVKADVVPVTVDSTGSLGVPADPSTLGWWAGGELPGSAAGATVIDGHVDAAATGAGALFELRNIQVGDTVTVTGDGPAVRYRIIGVHEYNKDDLPAAALFTRTGPPRLVLVTCGGPFNEVTHHYRDNIVAFGTPMAAS
jgi:sortase (surface protein transpeptidase)